jgi:hypothetical protein
LELLDGSMLLPAPPTFHIFRHSHKGKTLNGWIFCADLHAIILQLLMAFNGILPFQWRGAKQLRDPSHVKGNFCHYVVTPLHLRPADPLQCFLHGRYQEKKRKKNWSKSLLSIKPWVCANPYRLNPYNLRLYPTLIELSSSWAFHLCTGTNKCNYEL